MSVHVQKSHIEEYIRLFIRVIDKPGYYVTCQIEPDLLPHFM